MSLRVKVAVMPSYTFRQPRFYPGQLLTKSHSRNPSLLTNRVSVLRFVGYICSTRPESGAPCRMQIVNHRSYFEASGCTFPHRARVWVIEHEGGRKNPVSSDNVINVWPPPPQPLFCVLQVQDFRKICVSTF